MHNAGVLKGYQHETDIRNEIAATNLIFVVSNWHFIGVPGTVGLPGRYTGTYAQFRADWAITTYSSFAIEAVHFVVGDAIRRAGGHDSNYLGVQIAYGW
jgi:hypothetical protein